MKLTFPLLVFFSYTTMTIIKIPAFVDAQALARRRYTKLNVSLPVDQYSRAGEQLFEDLLFSYNKNVRPVKYPNETLMVNFAASLIRIIDLNEKTQQLTINLWLEMQWKDARLAWPPEKYDNIRKLNVPADLIWKPDIVLYTNADGDPHVTINVDTMVYADGTVSWKPPAIYRAFCEIDVRLFPYDLQTCMMKFGDWSYDGTLVEMRQVPNGTNIGPNPDGFDVMYLEMGMDLSYFQESAEWDLLNLTSEKHDVIYSSCCGSVIYGDIRFYIQLRRKALFFTVFLVIPCLLIALLTTFVSCLPSCSMKKMTLAISILVSLMVFFVALIDLVPPNSVVLPLLMKYLLFTMLLVCISIFTNVLALNLHYRNSSTHTMRPWVRRLFLQIFPRLLCMKIPSWNQIDPRLNEIKKKISRSVTYSNRLRGSFDRRPSPFFVHDLRTKDVKLSSLAKQRGLHPQVVKQMIANINGVAELFSVLEDDERIKEDWSYVALVVDRIFLWIFTVINIFGTTTIISEAVGSYHKVPLVIPKFPSKPLGGDTYTFS